MFRAIKDMYIDMRDFFMNPDELFTDKLLGGFIILVAIISISTLTVGGITLTVYFPVVMVPIWLVLFGIFAPIVRWHIKGQNRNG